MIRACTPDVCGKCGQWILRNHAVVLELWQWFVCACDILLVFNQYQLGLCTFPAVLEWSRFINNCLPYRYVRLLAFCYDLSFWQDIFPRPFSCPLSRGFSYHSGALTVASFAGTCVIISLEFGGNMPVLLARVCVDGCEEHCGWLLVLLESPTFELLVRTPVESACSSL